MVQEQESRGEEGVTQSKVFVKVKAAFWPDDIDPSQYEAMGMDMNVETLGVEMRDLYINIPRIVSVFINKHGGANIVTSDGDKWSTDEEGGYKLLALLEDLSVDLT